MSDQSQNTRMTLSVVIVEELREHGPEVGIDVATSVLLSSVVAVRRFMEQPGIDPARRADLAARLADIPVLLAPLLDAATAAEAMQRNVLQSDVTHDISTGRTYRPKVVG